MQVHGYTETGAIDATINGTRWTVPDDPSNGFRQMIRDEWEFDADGNRVNTIPPYVEPAEVRAATVDAERDRRTALGFAFGGKTIQSRPDDLLKITGAATAATVAVTIGGKQADDLRWSDPDADFVWIAADNSTLAMDAPTTIQFGQAALAHVAAYVFAARSIKDRIIAGDDLDPTDDDLWP